MSAVYEPSRSLPAKIGRRITQWRAARPVTIAPERPLLSISFDDFPASAVRHGLPILAEAGARATFYSCAGLAGQPSLFGPLFSETDFSAVLAEGHEVGCHTHRHLDSAQATPATVSADCARNAEGLTALGLAAAPRHLAYPYGETTFAVKQALRARFTTGRGILPGLNVGRGDAMQLRAVSLYGENADRAAQPWLEAAAARRAWLILFTHDLGPTPTRFGTTPDALAATLQTAKALGFTILPVGEAAQLALGEQA